jgi:4-amino-4-deoxy-L-arabinose transferase-like glycosyltransferase
MAIYLGETLTAASRTREELYEQARALAIPGRSKMTRAQLEAALSLVDEPTTVEVGLPAPPERLPPPRPAYAVWRSPDDQPPWARPALLAVAGLALLSYTWGATHAFLEPYYAAAVRSMSSSWHNLFFGSFDPAGSISLDKLPGALWLQAVSAHLFGVRRVAIVWPQAIEGVLTVLVLYRMVRQVMGPGAGLIAAGLLALSPAVVALDRGNISDTLMVLLVVLAADATLAMIGGASLRTAVLAGGLVGLAFQAKMLEAWLILPALAAAYLLASNEPWARRLRALAVAGGATLIVSLSWMTIVAVTPASHRPYADGSMHNSVYAQVFLYNGAGRISPSLAGFKVPSNEELGIPSVFTVDRPPGPFRMLRGAAGRDAGWLLGPALIAMVAILRRRNRDLIWASAVLWGGWLVTLALIFSVVGHLNAYYTAAMAPPMAALCATGITLVWRSRHRSATALRSAAAAVAIGAVVAVWLSPPSTTPGWLRLGVVVLASTAIALLLSAVTRPSLWTSSLGLAAAVAALAFAPLIASLALVVGGRGPFDTPFQTADVSSALRRAGGSLLVSPSTIAALDPAAHRRYLLATQTALAASPVTYTTGHEVLAIGGYTGRIPRPTLAELQKSVAAGEIRFVVAYLPTDDPRIVWIRGHCDLQFSYGAYDCNRHR